MLRVPKILPPGLYVLFLCGPRGFIFVCHGHMCHYESAIELDCDYSQGVGNVF